MTFNELANKVLEMKAAAITTNSLIEMKEIVTDRIAILNDVNAALSTGGYNDDLYKRLWDAKTALIETQHIINEKALQLHSYGVKNAETVYFEL